MSQDVSASKESPEATSYQAQLIEKFIDILRTHLWGTVAISLFSLILLMFNLSVYQFGLPGVSPLGMTRAITALSEAFVSEKAANPSLIAGIIFGAALLVGLVKALKYSHPLLYPVGLAIEFGKALFAVNAAYILVDLVVATVAQRLHPMGLVSIAAFVVFIIAIYVVYRYIDANPPYFTYVEITPFEGTGPPKMASEAKHVLPVDHQLVVRVCGPPQGIDSVAVGAEPKESWLASERRKEGYCDVIRVEPKTKLRGEVTVYRSGKKKSVLRSYQVEADGPSLKVLNISVLYENEEYSFPDSVVSTAKSLHEVTEELFVIKLRRRVDLSGKFISTINVSDSSLLNPSAPIRSLRLEANSQIHMLTL